jgi:hypothetical protein
MLGIVEFFITNVHACHQVSARMHVIWGIFDGQKFTN